ncbi:MAG: hypothetical protein KDC38_06830, partial [Planctomycetes bacterium]|nr:hypothetical protein [Planctomycetota bacterium]
RFFVNTFNGSAWSIPAFLTDDEDGYLDPDWDTDDPFTQDGNSRDFGFVPGGESGVPMASGSWLFWIRYTENASGGSIEHEAIQGRRIFDTVLPATN